MLGWSRAGAVTGTGAETRFVSRQHVLHVWAQSRSDCGAPWHRSEGVSMSLHPYRQQIKAFRHLGWVRGLNIFEDQELSA